MYELDNELASGTTTQPDSPNSGSNKRQSSRNGRSKLNRILLITATGDRVVLEATTAEERSTWIGEIRVAVSSLDISS